MNEKITEDGTVDKELETGSHIPEPERLTDDDPAGSDGMSSGWAMMWDQAALSELRPRREGAAASETPETGG